MSSSNDETRELIKELHGLIGDGDHLRREILTARTGIRAQVEAAAREIAAEYVAELSRVLEKHVADVRLAIDGANMVIQSEATRLAAVKSPEEFVAAVVTGVVHSPLATKAITVSLEKVAAEVMLKMLKAEDKREPPPGGKLPPAVFPSSVPAPFRPHHDRNRE